jgi:hypothetical protein
VKLNIRGNTMRKQWFLIAMLFSILILATGCITYNMPPSEAVPNESLPQGGQPTGETQVDLGMDIGKIHPGECVMLHWNVQGGDFFGVDLNGESVSPSGEKQVCPNETTTYTLTVDVGNAVINREVVVTVVGTGQTPQQPQSSSAGCDGAPVFSNFEAYPGSITSGQSATLEWGPITNGMTGPLVGSVVLTPGNFGEVGSPGSRQVSPTSTTTYTLTATGCGGTATKSVTVVVPIVGTPIPIPTPTPPGGGGWSGPPKVTNVVAYIPGGQSSGAYTGPCPATHYFVADVTVDGACTVTYRWERSDGATGPVQTLVFSGASTQQIGDTWILGGGPGTGTVWERVNVLTPLPMTSNQASVTITCTP